MEAHAHIVPAKTYGIILGALLVFTAITVGAAGINFGSPVVNVVVALTIATGKASLVALYFMHLRYDKPLNAVIFVAGLSCLGLFLMATFGDTAAREVVRPAAGSVVALPAE
ncbi:MAG TPA: cytochrome C oxidase subunit IV family protein [Bryobacteraceae bacterium]|nr:cytochrome C oxidase subunit IV family protein [Bryobacteraceae bacterium]